MKKKTETIKVSLTLLGRVYKATGKTVEEAITKLDPPIAKTVGILVLEKGDLYRERIINVRTVNGIFGKSSPIMKSLAIKNIITMFNDFNK